MILTEHLGAFGNRLFRWRSYLPLPIMALMLLGLNPPLETGLGWSLGCLTLSMAGLALRAVVVGHTPKRTSGRNTRKQIAAELNTTGLYSLVRHPLYLGNFLIWLGVSLFACTWWMTGLVVLLFILIYERVMVAEEAFLAKRFQGVFEEWADRTPAIIPDFSNYRKTVLDFSLRNVLKREYNGLLGILASFAVFDAAKRLVFEGVGWPAPLWGYLLLVGVLVSLLLRFLKRHTRILSVEGR